MLGLPEVQGGADVAALVVAALAVTAGADLRDGDVVVVASKVVAKAEGRVLQARSRDAAVARETVRVVAERRTPRGVTRVVEARSGPVLAAAGVDASNVEAGSVLLLPADPDASARALRARLTALTGHRLAVVVTDTLGRPWRDGQVDVAIGAAGLAVTDDLRGTTDAYGNPLEATVRALADQVAGAADLVKGKLGGVPVAVVRGLAALVTDEDGPGAAALLRTGAGDWFRFGHVEAVRAALGTAPARDVEPPHVAPEDVAARARRAVRLALRHRVVAASARVDVEVEVRREPGSAASAGSAGSAGPAGSTDGPARSVTRVTVRADDPVALGSVAERVAVAAWAEDLAATVLEEGSRQVVLQLADLPGG